MFSVPPDFSAGQSIISSPDFSVPCPHKEIGSSPPRSWPNAVRVRHHVRARTLTGRFESPETESLPASIDVRQILDFDL